MPWLQAKNQIASRAASRNAGKLRKTLTEPEKRLWILLRKCLPQQGTHFRRQVALGAYVVDFVCLAHKLVLEVDGDQHGSDQAASYDMARSAWLQRHGFHVLRFTNRQIMTEREMVIDTVFAALAGQLELCPPTPTPIPSPQGGGEALR